MLKVVTWNFKMRCPPMCSLTKNHQTLIYKYVTYGQEYFQINYFDVVKQRYWNAASIPLGVSQR